MPPRQPPANPRSPRRRPGPTMPGGWVWLVLLATVVIMIYLMDRASSPTISYSDFKYLVHHQNVSKLVFVGKERIVGELRKPPDGALPEDLQTKLNGSSKFSVIVPPVFQVAEDKELFADLEKQKD